MKKLTPKQLLFCEHIAAGRSQADAYKRAGYKDGPGAAAAASRLLKKDEIRRRIDQINVEVAKSSRFEREDAIRFLAEIIETPIDRVTPDSRLAQELVEATDRSGRKIKMPGKIEALREMAKMLGWYEPERSDDKLTVEFVKNW